MGPLEIGLTDAELVRACRDGDPDAWPALVHRFARYVHAIAVRAYRLSESDAEDVFQEVFARAYEHLDRLRDDAAIRPWLAQLTRRLAIDRLRATQREQPTAGEEPADALDPRAGGEFERLERALAVQQAMVALPDGCREILDRFFAQDQSYAQISDALDIPMGTIASRISRCLTKLRAAFEDEDG
jgi:RNA polymerase sigma factor (sigma-70 family)